VFTLFDRIALRDLDASLEVLAKLLLSREADAVSLLAGLLFQVRKLRDLKLLIEKRYSYEEAFAQVGVPGKRVQKTYSAALQRYTLRELQAIIQLIARFDYRVRSLGAVLHPNLLQLFLYYLIVRGGSGAFGF
jgi:DNA polymerase-3 subunit delta